MTRCPRCQRRLPPSGDCPSHGRPTGGLAEAAQALPHVAPPPPWRLERHLATGGTAHVFLVARPGGSHAILKWGRWRERDIHVRFELEAAVLRAIGPAWTPELHDHGARDGWPYLLMERIAGETLAAWMSRAGDRGGLGEILALLDQLASGVAALHGAGIVHRDLKPENVLIGPRGVRLIDFGLARLPGGPGLTQVGAIVGTVHYLAPEQIRGTTVDHRADLYSFGVIAFEMLCGCPPFVGERRAIEYQHSVCRPPSVREWRQVPDELDQLVAACLAKQPEARPQSAAEIRARIARAVAGAATVRGFAPRELGVRGRVALVWASGADPLAVVRAVSEVSGVVVRRRGDGVLAAFTGLDHENPVAAALDAAHALVHAAERARCVLHAATALIRRSAQGKLTAYGDDVEHAERWVPAAPGTGILLTAAAAELSPEPSRPAPEAPGWFRTGPRERAGASPDAVPPLVGRGSLIERLAEIAGQALDAARPVHVAISGASGAGKTRVLEALRDRLRAAGHEVIWVRGQRRFAGERADDPVGAALGAGGERTLAAALAEAAARGAVIAIDDAAWLPAAVLRTVERAAAAGDGRLAVITASAAPPGDREASHRVDVVLPPLAFGDAEVLVRELLRPARLIPRVLVERLAIRAGGLPGLLVALAREIARRGAVRRHVGGDEWYVAADELDTLLAAPSEAWFALRTLEDLPAELGALVRACAVLGPRFCAGEVAAVCGGHPGQLAALVAAGVLRDDRGWYAFADAGIQDAIAAHAAHGGPAGLVGHDDAGRDERAVVHGRAFRYWLAEPDVDPIARLARLAHHGEGAHETLTAATCYLALARAARERGEPEIAEHLLARALACAPGAAPRLQATARIERARLFYASRRFADARDDAATARRLADQAGDLEAQLDALVVESLAAAGAGDHEAANAAAVAASAITTADIAPAVRARVLGAIGQARAREARRDEAIAALHLATALAEALGDRATADETSRALDPLVGPARTAGDR